MARPYVSNQNNRTNAILKVVGIYLATFVFLFLVVFLNAKQNTKADDNASAKVTELSNEKDQLQKMVLYMDTLSAINRQLIRLDSSIFIATNATDETERIRVEGINKDQLTALLGMGVSNNLIDDHRAIVKVYNQLRANRLKMKKLLDDMTTLKQEQENKVEATVDDKEEEIDLSTKPLEEQIALLKEDKIRLENDMKIEQSRVERKDEEILAIKANTASVLGQLNEINGLVQAELGKNKPFRRENQVNVLYSKLTALKSLIEAQSK